MDRKTQLANVAFGGSWVDAIEAREDLAKALDAVRTACSDCMERDVRDTALREMRWIIWPLVWRAGR